MSSRIVAKLSTRDAARMLERGQIRLGSGGELRVIGPNRSFEHPARTRISSGGVLAAIGMSQIYTTDDDARKLKVKRRLRFKRIFPEDRRFFHLATNPGAEFLVAVSFQLSALSSALGFA
jgi:hypothetical protein